eukprot:13190555-Alexandrium_andersonii.AAC.1
MPVYDSTCQCTREPKLGKRCKQLADGFGHHGATCKVAGGPVLMHDAVVMLFHEAASEAGIQ